MLGFIIAFWATPHMTLGHLVFAIATSAYVLLALVFEEKDLVHLLGDDYREYRKRVGMLIPSFSKSATTGSAAADSTVEQPDSAA
jgi:protein-S-isoprenylcysteine O-methyltransferase Ste14